MNDQDELPDSWYENNDIETEDVFQGAFLTDDGKPGIILFSRRTRTWAAPMVLDRTNRVWVAIGCDIKGIIFADVYLKLKDINGTIVQLKIPHRDLAEKHMKSSTAYLNWVKEASTLLKEIQLPSFMFVRPKY